MLASHRMIPAREYGGAVTPIIWRRFRQESEPLRSKRAVFAPSFARGGVGLDVIDVMQLWRGAADATDLADAAPAAGLYQPDRWEIWRGDIAGNIEQAKFAGLAHGVGKQQSAQPNGAMVFRAIGARLRPTLDK